MMDFSFPCVGNLDDGIFHDLGIEDDRVGAAKSSTDDGVDQLQSMVLSPDALDLALMAFDLEEEGRGGADTQERGHGETISQSSHSPFCDAAIGHQDRHSVSPVCAAASPTTERRATRDTDSKRADTLMAFRNVHSTAPGVAFGQPPAQKPTSFDSGGDRQSSLLPHKSSNRPSPTRWTPAKEKGGGAAIESKRCISKAFPPRLPEDDADRGASISKTQATPVQRGVEAQSPSRRFAAQSLSRPSQADSAGGKSPWARHRAATCEAAVVSFSVRKEEEALAEANHTTQAAGAPDTCARHRTAKRAAPTGVDSAREKRKVSFADEFAGLQVEEDAAEEDGDDDDGDREWQRKTDASDREGGRGAGAREGGPGEGEGEQERGEGGAQNDDDLLARASELHSSVAGQLRSVNELLKRKSYFYIDTSWSAKQLPCPPTAWKGKGAGCAAAPGGAGDGSIVIGTESSSSGKPRYRSVALPADARNLSVRVEGRWVSAGSKKPKVGIHSIVGEKVHDPSWKNQDAGLAIAPLDRREGQALFAVFDGHGTNGRQASHECKERLPKYLVSASHSGNPASALRRSCQRLHRDLVAGVAGDCARSGTTLCAAVLTGRRLTVANVGDSGCLRLSRRTPSPGGAAAIAAVAAAVPVKSSRASDSSGVVGAGSTSRRRKRGAAERSLLGTGETTTGGGRGRLVAERLSRDHKPESKGELERIQAAGGIVFPLPNRDASSGGEGDVAGATFTPAAGCDQRLMTVRDFRAGVPRVWAGGNGPGLAMSRSIGDKMAHSVGVTFEPDIMEFDLDPRSDVMLVLATDGVWDVLSAEDIRKAAELHVVNDGWCPQALSSEICRRSLSEWATVTSGGSDDITCLIVKTLGVVPHAVTAQRKPTAEVAKQGNE